MRFKTARERKKQKYGRADKACTHLNEAA